MKRFIHPSRINDTRGNEIIWHRLGICCTKSPLNIRGLSHIFKIKGYANRFSTFPPRFLPWNFFVFYLLRVAAIKTEIGTSTLTFHASYITASCISIVGTVHLLHLTFCFRSERIIYAFFVLLVLPRQRTRTDINMHLCQERCCLTLHMITYLPLFLAPFAYFCTLFI